MADARRAHAERRATRVAQTAPVRPAGVHWSPSLMVSATTGPGAQEQQGSSYLDAEQPDGCTATPFLVQASGSSSRAQLEMPNGWRALAMAAELLSYRPASDRHNEWLQRTEELVVAVGDPAVLSCSFRPQP
ncbi:hypothetical protein D1007_01593 [Hordeum vulgare]|nr:hypothetical protein D1007_01593 [Hordeum vulgare]